ncbi:MAG: hypothetical protein QNJ90_00155 [Planctomycetota bacterium]|nr:hypothetical protein [Planctomycetota bacterium]
MPLLDLLARLLLACLFFGPAVFVMHRTVNPPAKREPQPPRPVSMVLTLMTCCVVLMPIWAALAWRTGFDPLGTLSAEGDIPLLAYALGGPALVLAWRTNGPTRERANVLLAGLQGAAFAMYVPSFVAFVWMAAGYETHT